MNQTVTISKFKATCLRLLDDVYKTGKPLLITRNGEPIALVSPPPSPPKSDDWIGSMRDKLELTGDVVAPASDETEWEVLGDFLATTALVYNLTLVTADKRIIEAGSVPVLSAL